MDQLKDEPHHPLCWVVNFASGPRKRPTLKGKVLVWADDPAEAVTKTRKNQRWRWLGNSAGLRLGVHRAHPVRDRDASRVIFPRRPIDSGAPLPAPLRSSQGMYCVTCKCGYSADVDDFCRSPSGIELPRNEYQCPKCFKAWRVQAKGDCWVTDAGQVIPPGRETVPILPRA